MDKKKVQLLKGFGFLVRIAKSLGKETIEEFLERCCLLVPVSKHPFGCDIPEEIMNHPVGYNKIQFFSTGGTESSINGIATFVVERVTGDPEQKPILYLRVILVEDDENASQHRVYYEVGFNNEIVITGNCTDFSGSGGFGKEMMDALFALLAELYEINIEEVVLPFSRWAEINTIVMSINKEVALRINE